MASQNMDFRRILGFTASGRNSFVMQPKSGNLIYIAGCVIIVYNPHSNTQNHLLTESKQTITTLAISDDGRYLAAADSGNQAMIRVWDLTDLVLLIEIEAHDFEFVTCMSFSGDGHILMSIGSHYEYPLPRLKAWNWRTKALLVREYVSAKTRAISCELHKGNFVIVSEASVQYWSLSPSRQPDGLFQVNKSSIHHGLVESDEPLLMADQVSTRISINRWDATLGIHREKNFCDVKCGRGIKSGFTFCIAEDGLLCELNEQGHLHKFVDVKTKSANCLGVSDNLIAVGCASGLIRCFTATELKFIRNLPRPHKLGTDVSGNSNINSMSSSQSSDSTSTIGKPIYPDVISVVPDEVNNTIACVYNDRSIYIWDLSKPSCVVKRYSALYHSSCIWGIDMYPALAMDPLLPPGSFITCSSDDTIRIWQPRACNKLNSANTPVDESLKIIFTDSTYKFLCNTEPVQESQDYDSNEGLRCLKISPNGKQLAVGSRSGTIKIYDLTNYTEMKSIAAHDAEVLCLEYSDPKKFDGFCYLASSSRDKLIHIFDVSNGYTFLQTIDDHQSTITSLKFVNNIASDCLQLVSCGADKKIIFRYGSKLPDEQQLNFTTKQFIIGKSTFYDMEVDSESSCLMAACQDKMIRLFNVAQMKYQSSFKGSFSDDGTLIKIALDPSCTFLAASSTNKTINIYDYQRGECIASITDGLSDLVTDLKFSPDGRYLVACSGNGCIFIWSSPPEIANTISGSLQATNLDHLSLSSCSLGLGANKQQLEPMVQERVDIAAASQQLALSDVQRIFGGQQVDLNGPKPAGNVRNLINSARSGGAHSISGQFNDKQQQEQQQNSVDQRKGRFVQSGSSNLRKSTSLGLSRSAHILNSAGRSHCDTSEDDEGADEEDEELSRLAKNQPIRAAGGNLANSLSMGRNKSVVTPPKSSLYKQIRRSGYITANQVGPTQAAAANSGRLNAFDSYNQHSGHYMGSSYRAKTLSNRSRLHNGASREPQVGSSATLRPSKSECNLEISANSVTGVDGGGGGKLATASYEQPNAASFVYSEKLDLNKMNLSSVPISQELCQYVVDELQAISKFATRLHQTLQTNPNNRHLCGLLARGVQNSMDILSIVPPRATHQRQFQSQVNLSPVSMITSARKGAGERNQQQQQQQPLLLQRGSSALSERSVATLTQHNQAYLSRKANRFPATEIRLKRAGSEVVSNERDQDVTADSGFVNGSIDATLTGNQRFAWQPSDATKVGSSSSPSKADQVLESYADRLFRMIQERCDQSTGVAQIQQLVPQNQLSKSPHPAKM